MKNRIIFLLCSLLILISVNLHAGSFTTNGLYKPAVNEVGWGALMNDNTDILERYISTITIATDVPDALTFDATGNGTWVGTLATDGFILGDNETIGWATGTITHDGTDFVFNDTLRLSTMTQNNILFIGASGLISEDSNFTWTGSEFAVTGTQSYNGVGTWTGGGIKLNDNIPVTFGSGSDISIDWDEDGTFIAADTLFISGTGDIVFGQTGNMGIGVTATPASKFDIASTDLDLYKGTLTLTDAGTDRFRAFGITVDDDRTTAGGVDTSGVFLADFIFNHNTSNTTQLTQNITGLNFLLNLAKSSSDAQYSNVKGFAVTSNLLGGGTVNYDRGHLQYQSFIVFGGAITVDITEDLAHFDAMTFFNNNSPTISARGMYGLQIGDLMAGATPAGGTITDLYGIKILPQTDGGIATNFGGMWMAGDGAGSDIVFGAGQEHRIFSESSTELAIRHATKLTLGDGTNETAYAADGFQTMAGTARVMISIDLEPVLATRPSANPPGEGTEDSFPTHDFNATTDESVFFHLELAHDYASAGVIHVHFDFFVDTAPAGAQGVVWGVEYKKQSIGDNFDFSSGTATLYTTTAVTTGTPANDKKVHQSAEINLDVTGFEPNDYILLRMFRDADGTGGTDDFPNDARVIDYHIEYLSDKIGEAT
ncbi:hypothetical protein LCGC14_1114550 [marine sediment metagenome]|uniref:Uncharacterized protein n=1 Tax=marine sediment metagenome TaxID=412755 RepID=A0A0F9MAI2_9ZZZZ|nr:hypothetical protein [Candidatus Aminicenantes bacterium]